MWGSLFVDLWVSASLYYYCTLYSQYTASEPHQTVTVGLECANLMQTFVCPIFLVGILDRRFMGLEIVSIELDDPSFSTISDAANDMIMNVLGFAQTVFEDTFMMIHDADGESWADALRYKMHQNAQEPLSPTELTGLLNTSSLT